MTLLSFHQLLYSRSGHSEVGADGPDNQEHADGLTLKRRLACMCDASLLSFFVLFPNSPKLTCFRNFKGLYDAISSFPFSLECYKLFVHR